MLIEPAAVVVLPIVGLAALRRRWTFLLLLVSVPFFTLEVVTAASHPFTFPEIVMMVFVAQQVAGWIREGRIRLPNGAPVVLLWVFAGVAALSVIALAIRGSPALVHPYENTFQSQSFVPLTVSQANLTQLFLRVFFVVSVTTIAVALDRERLELAVRGLVYGAVLTVIVGLAYQAAIVTGLTGPISLLSEFGFRRFGTSPGSVGPLPRMYSLPGEPGYTADHVLYGFALVATLTVSRGRDWVFRRGERLGLVAVLGGGVLASTGTTGYGGLLVLAGVLAGTLALAPSIRPAGLRRYLALGVAVVATVAAVVAVAFGPTVLEVVQLQVRKMTFQARSGSRRLFYMQRSLDVFRHHPLLGAGVGSHASPAYLFTLLAETGIVGVATLSVAHLWPYRQCVGLLDTASPPLRRGAATVAVAGATLFFTNLVAKSTASLIMPWYWFGLALPIAVVAHASQQGGPGPERSDESREHPGGTAA